MSAEEDLQIEHGFHTRSRMSGQVYNAHCHRCSAQIDMHRRGCKGLVVQHIPTAIAIDLSAHTAASQSDAIHAENKLVITRTAQQTFDDVAIDCQCIGAVGYGYRCQGDAECQRQRYTAEVDGIQAAEIFEQVSAPISQIMENVIPQAALQNICATGARNMVETFKTIDEVSPLVTDQGVCQG